MQDPYEDECISLHLNALGSKSQIKTRRKKVKCTSLHIHAIGNKQLTRTKSSSKYKICKQQPRNNMKRCQ